jgi:hypothetical protein
VVSFLSVLRPEFACGFHISCVPRMNCACHLRWFHNPDSIWWLSSLQNSVSSCYIKLPSLGAQRSYVCWGFEITHRHTTLGRSPADEESAPRRGRYCFLLGPNIPSTLFSDTRNARDQIHCLFEVTGKTSVS